MAFVSLNPADRKSGGSLTDSYLNLSYGGLSGTARATSRLPAGSKTYWEGKLNFGSGAAFGIVDADHDLAIVAGLDASNGGWAYWSSNGNTFINGVSAAYGSSWSSSAVVGVALDQVIGAIWFHRDGVWQGGATIEEIEAGDTTNAAATGVALQGDLFPAFSVDNSQGTINFGDSAFSYSAPTGFQAGVTYDPGFATLNPADKGSQITLYGGGVIAEDTTSGLQALARATVALPASAKVYWEQFVDSRTTGTACIGLVTAAHDVDKIPAWDTTEDGFGYPHGNGAVYKRLSSVLTGLPTFGTGDTVGAAIDQTLNALWFHKNGVWVNGATQEEIESGDTTNAVVDVDLAQTLYIALGADDYCRQVINLGATTFKYPVPAGFDAGLAMPSISVDAAIELALDINATVRALPTSADLTLAALTASASIVHGTVNLPALQADASTMDVAGTLAGLGATGNHQQEFSDITLPAFGAAASMMHAGMALPRLGAAGTHQQNYTDITLPALQVDGTAEQEYSDLTLPALSASGSYASTKYAADIILTALRATGGLLNGPVLQASARLPGLGVQASMAATARVALPALSADGALKVGTVARAALTLRALRGQGEIDPAAELNAAIRLPQFRARGTFGTGAHATATAVFLPGLGALGRLRAGHVFSGALSLPALRASAAHYGEYRASADLRLPGMLAVGRLLVPVPLDAQDPTLGQVFAMNTETFAVSRYRGPVLHSLGTLGDVYLAAGPDGIFALEGEDDEGVAIEAVLRWGYTDFAGIEGLDNEALKRVIDAYVGARTAGDLSLSAKVDGERHESVYPLHRRRDHRGVRGERVKLGRGVKSRYWQFALRSSGVEFELDSVGFLVRELRRKVG